MLKFRYYEKATKFEKISDLFWQNSCFYQGFHSVVSKLVGDFFFKFLAFSEKLDFTLTLEMITFLASIAHANKSSEKLLKCSLINNLASLCLAGVASESMGAN